MLNINYYTTSLRSQIISKVQACTITIFIITTPNNEPVFPHFYSSMTSSWTRSHTLLFRPWPFHLQHGLCTKEIKKGFSEMFLSNISILKSFLTVCRSRTWRSLKHVAWDPPPNIRRYLSAWQAAAWSDLGEGGVPLKKSNENNGEKYHNFIV